MDGTAKRFGQGFEWAVVAKLGSPEDVVVYEKHPAHLPYVAISFL